MQLNLDLSDFDKQDLEELHNVLQLKIDDLDNKVQLYEHIMNRLDIVDCQILDFLEDNDLI